MTLIVPDRTITEQTRVKMKKIVKACSAVLLIMMIVGLVLLLSGEALIETVGKYMFYIPLAVIVVQIILGIIVKIIFKTKNKS